MVTPTSNIHALVGAYATWANERHNCGSATTLSQTVQKLEELSEMFAPASTDSCVTSVWDGFAQQEVWYDGCIWRYRARGPDGYDSREGFATTQYLAMEGARCEAVELRKRAERDLMEVRLDIEQLNDRKNSSWMDKDEMEDVINILEECKESEQRLVDALSP